MDRQIMYGTNEKEKEGIEEGEARTRWEGGRPAGRRVYEGVLRYETYQHTRKRSD